MATYSRLQLFGRTEPRANLSRARLTRADLTRANLRGANLRGANLNGANLRGANLKGAVADEETVWPNQFLQTVRRQPRG